VTDQIPESDNKELLCGPQAGNKIVFIKYFIANHILTNSIYINLSYISLSVLYHIFIVNNIIKYYFIHQYSIYYIIDIILENITFRK
jgi:hypothetical protein